MLKMLQSLKTKIYLKYFDQVVNTPEAIQKAVEELSEDKIIKVDDQVEAEAAAPVNEAVEEKVPVEEPIVEIPKKKPGRPKSDPSAPAKKPVAKKPSPKAK